MVKRKNIAIIPARGGSKRIKKKNMTDFCGKPLLCWTIEAAQDSHLFDRILVSTEAADIAELASSMGIDVPFLRDQYYDDHTPVSMATLSTIARLREEFNETYENVFQLMPTCPLRKAIHIKEAYNQYINGNSSFIISVSKYSWLNPWWACTLDASDYCNPLFPGQTKKRSQDLSDLYCPSGAIWIARVESLLEEKSFLNKTTRVYEMSWQDGIDIDTYDDLELAQTLYRMKENNKLSP